MKIRKVTVAGFGPLREATLEFAEGMTVVYGPNESAKTSLHAATYAAICGMRRSRGQPRAEDRAFADRHRPWDGGPWRASALLTLADDREIEISHDLAGGVDCRAIDVALRRDVSAEIMTENTPDASVWLGFDRTSFLATACVRQAQIAAVLDQPDALQDELQRAAASAGRDETAADAIARLVAYRSEHVGQDRRNSTKPLRAAIEAQAEAERKLAEARAEHERYLTALAELGEHEAERNRARAELALAEAAVARDDARRRSEQLERASMLAERYPEEPPDAGGNEELADRVSEALTLWDSRPPEPDLGGPTAKELDRELASLPERPVGDLVPATDVTAARSAFEIATRTLDEHARLRPAAVADDDRRGASPDQLDERAHRSGGRTLGLLAAGAAAVAAAVAFALGSTVAALVLLVLAAVVAAVVVRRGDGQAPSTETPDAAHGRLAETWERRRSELEAERARAETAYRVVLEARGVAVEDDLEAAFRLYVDGCAAREEQEREALRRPVIEQKLQTRRAAEAASEQRTAAIEQLRSVAADAGIVESDPSRIAAALRDWQRHRLDALEGQSLAQREWKELQMLLDGGTLDDLRTLADEALTEADIAASRVDAAALAGADAESFRGRLAHFRAVASAKERAASEAHGRVEQLARTLPSVAEAEERVAAAQSELERVRRLERTLDETIRFLEAAQERVHRDIAPILSRTLREWLPSVAVARVGDRLVERYDDARVAPDTLKVEVRRGEGPWRNASNLSEGTKEQIYLLLRVALAQHLTTGPEVAPLILDEITAQCDPDRRVALLSLLHRLSAERQVILFTHDEGALVWAEEHLDPARDRLERRDPVAVA